MIIIAECGITFCLEVLTGDRQVHIVVGCGHRKTKNEALLENASTRR